MTKKELETAIKNAVKKLKSDAESFACKEVCEIVKKIYENGDYSGGYCGFWIDELANNPEKISNNPYLLIGTDNDIKAAYMFYFFFLYHMRRYGTTSLEMLTKISYDDFYLELEGKFLQQCQTIDEITDEITRDYNSNTFIAFLHQITQSDYSSTMLKTIARTYLNYIFEDFTKIDKMLENYINFISVEKSIVELNITSLKNFQENIKTINEFIALNFQYNAEIHEDRFKDTLNREIYIFQNFAQKLNENIEKYIEKQKDSQNA